MKQIYKNISKNIMVAFISINVLTTQSQALTGVGEVVFDPTSYASLLESIEKYNTMIRSMQDTLDTMNRINDVMNTASNQLNNLQTGLADPRQLVDRFQSNIQNMENNFNRIQNNLKDKQWKDSIISSQYIRCSQKWQNLKNKYLEEYKNNPLAKELDANMKWIDSVNNNGLIKTNEDIHSFFDGVVDKMDITDIEAKISNSKDPKQTIINICKTIELEELKKQEEQCLKDYHQAVKEKNLSKANISMTCILDSREEQEKTKNKATKELLGNIEKNNIFEIDTNKPTLSINPNNCQLIGDWKQIFGNNINTNNIAEKIKNQSNGREICIVKESVIKDLINNGKTLEALNLQNERNMGLAISGDTYALQQAQLGTLQLINTQISELHNSLKYIGQIAQEFIKKDDSYNDKNIKAIKNNDKTQISKFADSIKDDDYIPGFEYNRWGMPIRKRSNSNNYNNIIK